MSRSAGSRSPDVAPALIAAIGELEPAVAEHRREFDSNGQVPDDLFERLASLGLFRLLLPATLGGCTFASQSALWAIDLVTEMAGAKAIMRSSPLERRERDARAAAKHVAMSPAAYITGGKHRLGCDLSTSSF